MDTTELSREEQTIRLSPAPAPFSHHGKEDPKPLPIHTKPKCARWVQAVMFPITPHSPTNVLSWFQILQLHCCPRPELKDLKDCRKMWQLVSTPSKHYLWQVTTHTDSSKGALFTWHLIFWKACDIWGYPYPSDPTPWTLTRGELKSISALFSAGTTSPACRKALMAPEDDPGLSNRKMWCVTQPVKK